MAEGKAKSWYSTGYTELKTEEARSEMGNGPNRVWIPANGKKELVFVDDEPACIHEHSPKLNGEWKNWITCCKDVYDDVACCEMLNGAGYKPYYIGYYTVIDCTAWTDKKGKTYQYELKYFPAKMQTLKRLQSRKTDIGSFAGKLFGVQRLGDKSPSSGDDFNIIKDADMSKLFALANYKGKKLSEWIDKCSTPEGLESVKNIFQLELVDGKAVPKIVPFNYFKLLHPMTPKDIRITLNGAKIEARDSEFGGGGDTVGGGDGKADETIPF